MFTTRGKVPSVNSHQSNRFQNMKSKNHYPKLDTTVTMHCRIEIKHGFGTFWRYLPQHGPPIENNPVPPHVNKKQNGCVFSFPVKWAGHPFLILSNPNQQMVQMCKKHTLSSLPPKGGWRTCWSRLKQFATEGRWGGRATFLHGYNCIRTWPKIYQRDCLNHLSECLNAIPK